MAKDEFGVPRESLRYGRGEFCPVGWDNSSTAGVTYLRGDYDSSCLICRIDEAAGTVTWAFGAWSNRTRLSYGDDRIMER